MSKKSLFALMSAAFLCPALFAQGRGDARPLPEGAGKETVQGACQACHALGLISNAGHTREDWQTVVAQMRNAGAKVPEDQVPAIVDYLSKNLPEKPAPPAVVVPGNVKVNIKEWNVPTPGSRPHDPLAARDGTIWYTGHMANILGHLDPKNG
jgi:virginiamycin B lyase